jgi:arabinan endo-1,5-alpha-L-arabinosidase
MTGPATDAGTPPPAQTTDASTSGPDDAEAAVDAASPDAASADASVAGDRCDVAVHDPANPPQALSLSGNLGTHDPTLIEQDGVFYLWQTGPRVPGKTSRDLMSWQGASSALGASNPGWISTEVPGARDLWAPDVSHFGGRYHLYYSASTFGSNYSCIGHATRDSLASGSWSDQGSVVCSNHGSNDDWNAIDPNVVVDEDGTPWLSFGSFWSGLKAIELDVEGERANDQVHAIASRGGGAIEAPVIVRRCGYYYLFVSFDRCCNGASSTYNIRVGRSTDVLGPYRDRAGRAMMEGGGTLLVSGEGRWNGPGHNAVFFSGDRAYNVYHAYDGNSGGASVLRVAELVWDDEGWPISGGP